MPEISTATEYVPNSINIVRTPEDDKWIVYNAAGDFHDWWFSRESARLAAKLIGGTFKLYKTYAQRPAIR